MSIKLLAAALGAVVLLPILPVAANEAAFRDGDEQPFCEGDPDCPDDNYMDFRRLSQGHGTEHRNIRHGIRTLKRWPTRDLGGPHGVSFLIGFDIDGDAGREREIRIRRKDGHLWAGMFKGRGFWKRTPVPGHIRVWRPTRFSVKVGFATDLLAEGLDKYRWSVSWGLRKAGCTGSCESDDAPNRGWYTHRL